MLNTIQLLYNTLMSNRSTHADIEKEHKFWSTQVPSNFAASIRCLLVQLTFIVLAFSARSESVRDPADRGLRPNRNQNRR